MRSRCSSASRGPSSPPSRTRRSRSSSPSGSASPGALGDAEAFAPRRGVPRQARGDRRAHAVRRALRGPGAGPRPGRARDSRTPRPAIAWTRCRAICSVPAHVRWSACRWAARAWRQAGEPALAGERLAAMELERAKAPHAARYLLLAEFDAAQDGARHRRRLPRSPGRARSRAADAPARRLRIRRRHRPVLSVLMRLMVKARGPY